MDMDPVFTKLQLKEQSPVWVVGAPESFDGALRTLSSRDVRRDAPPEASADFLIVFVRSCAEIDAAAPSATRAMRPDGILWFAYPKKSSKRLKSDVGRDDSWAALGVAGFEGVRQVAIDDDWSALRFRRVEHIRTLRRDPKRALTATGKARAANARDPSTTGSTPKTK